MEITKNGKKANIALLTDFGVACLQLSGELQQRYDKPTPIQSAVWPIADLHPKNNLIAIAKTGSGKTVAFAYPLLRHAAQSNHRGVPSALVVVPTRELASQVASVVASFCSPLHLRCVCVYGGVSKREQRDQLSEGCDILVATPGRLLDVGANIAKVSLMVLDEADRMLDMGFERDVRDIAERVGRSVLYMFSATWPESVRAFAGSLTTHLSKHSTFTVRVSEESVPLSVDQRVEVIEDACKQNRVISLLRGFLKNDKCIRVLVFALYKREADRIFHVLKPIFKQVAVIHGDMSQEAREASLKHFSGTEKSILVATDVASRGLDIPNVYCVLNMTFPLTIEDYVHRIGRTGRAGQPGIAHTLFTPNDRAHSGRLIKVLRDSEQIVPEALLQFGTAIVRKKHSAYGDFYKDIDQSTKGTRTVFE